MRSSMQKQLHWTWAALGIIFIGNFLCYDVIHKDYGNFLYKNQKLMQDIEEVTAKQDVDRDFFVKKQGDKDNEVFELQQKIMPSCLIGSKT